MSLSQPRGHELAQRPQQVPALAHGDPTHFLPKADPGRFFLMLLKRSWMLLLPVLLGAVGLYLAADRLPKTYRATGSVYVGSQAPVVLDIRAVSQEETKDLEQMRSVEQGLGASTLLMRVIEANHLEEDPTFAPPGTGRQALVQNFARRVSVELRRGTRIIDLAVQDSNPERARKLVESLVAEYERWATERQREITRQANEGLAREEERLKQRMLESSKRIQQFREENPIPGLEGSNPDRPVHDALEALNAQMTLATAERLRLEAEFETYAKFDSSKPECLAGIEKSERGSEVLAQVREIQRKEAEFARVKERYLHKHPVYREIANELETLRNNLTETVESAGKALEQRYQIARENETKLTTEVTKVRGTAVESEGVRDQFRAMTREAEADRDLHASVSQRLRETNLAASVPSSVLRWDDTPLTPEKPYSPKKLVFSAGGAVFGFVLGAMLIGVAELSDRKIRNAASAARAVGSPLLATVPAIENPGDGMVLMRHPASVGAEAFRRLRVVLAPHPGGNTGRTVLFASAQAGEGKSFCALNHATSLAMQGHRTLLLDADLRSPGLSRDFLSGDQVQSGLGGYLDGKVDPASACYATSLPNLYILTSGPMRKDAAELLAGTRFPSLLEDAFRWFDRVVIDAPSALAVSDSLAVARYADRCCLVVREGCSDRMELRKAADLLRSAGGNLVGFVWNEESDISRRDSAGPVAPVNRSGLGPPQPVGVTSGSGGDALSVVATLA